jgi:hypothetical protein
MKYETYLLFFFIWMLPYIVCITNLFIRAQEMEPNFKKFVLYLCGILCFMGFILNFSYTLMQEVEDIAQNQKLIQKGYDSAMNARFDTTLQGKIFILKP